MELLNWEMFGKFMKKYPIENIKISVTFDNDGCDTFSVTKSLQDEILTEISSKKEVEDFNNWYLETFHEYYLDEFNK